MNTDYTLCPNCRDRYMPPGSAKCHACREQDAIDAEAWLDEDDPPGHVGFDMDVDGVIAHVLGDPNMDARTRDALAELIRCAVKMMDDKYGPPEA